MKVLVVDDEPLARTRLLRLLEEDDRLQVVAEAENGEKAISAFNQHRPEVVLMDIRMPVMDGLESARHLAADAQPPAVIFCTAYGDYALEAFEANAVDYLLKPVDKTRLQQALARAQTLNRVQINALEASAGGGSRRSHIAAKSSRGIELIPLENVRYFLADQKYVTVYHLTESGLKEILIDDPLKELEQELGEGFVRVHRNALVAVEHIQGLERGEQGARLKLADVTTGPQVSRRHLPAVRKLLQGL